ncbi:tetrapyrrole (Corrin/Porphyrin) methylases [Ceratobasidium sp. AG-Ba]|nr:tetrapyrrole (Corrin/Porphyrin) methylases [Ceratobasidium sp. AG-Ba]
MRWVAQLSEYTPLEQLAAMDEAAMRSVLTSRSPPVANKPASTGKCPRSRSRPPTEPAPNASSIPSYHNLAISPPPKPSGQIILVGSGPGHPGLLTRAAHYALTQLSTIVLADKLVPAEIMGIIPKDIEVKVAKKFPGNAEHAQDEFIALAIEGAKAGKCVVRLKQGDPFLYGRGGEEVLAFRKAGYEPTVIPGISSSLAAPLLVGIPITQRGVADSVVICTAVGKGGKGGVIVGYERGRSVSILMGVARLGEVVRCLMNGRSDVGAVEEVKGASMTPVSASTLSASKPPTLSTSAQPPSIPTTISQLPNSPLSPTTPHTPVTSPLTLSGPTYPRHTPIAIIERASSPDQRLVGSTLDGIERALARSGGSRPPGMILVGWAVMCLFGEGDVGILDNEGGDKERVKKWLGDAEHVVREGLPEGWDAFGALGGGTSGIVA